MKRRVITSELLEDGHLSISAELVKKLRLKKGIKIELSIEKIFETKKKKEYKPFSKLGVCGIWADRKDMKDSQKWVEGIREQWMR